MRNIETIKSAQLLLQELKKQNEKFNVTKFYESLEEEDYYKGAIQLIMPSHTLSFFSNNNHRLAVENVYRLIYSDFETFQTHCWQDECNARGDVLIVMCALCGPLAFIPEEITRHQFKDLMLMYARVEGINTDILSENITPPSYMETLTVLTNLRGINGEMLSFKDALPLIRERVKEEKTLKRKIA